jgi:hypothetical protein
MMAWLLRWWRWLQRLKEMMDKARAKILTDFWAKEVNDDAAKRKRKGGKRGNA